MSLKSYCEENNRMYLLREWDTEKNLPITPDTVAHTRCEKGHSWCTQVRSRSKSSTGCPKCREEQLDEKRRQRIAKAQEVFLKKTDTTGNSAK